MNQEKIGKFIATLRKEQNLTQMQLAETLGITDRAVSKWERGKSLPDVSVMLELCNILHIEVSELLNGERIMKENYNEKQEQLLLDMAKKLEKKTQVIWRAMWAILTVSILGILTGGLLIAYFVPEGIWQAVGMIGVCILFLPPCFFALKMEISVGAYKCKNCGHEIVPTYFQALNALHMGTTRYLKCPECGKRTWCKKVLKKEQ